MSLVLDIVCLLLLVGGFAVGWSRSPLSSGLTLFSAAVALTGAFFLSVPAGSWVSETLVAPLVEQSAANELADMVSAPHLSSGRETVAELPLSDMARQNAAPFARLVGRYGADEAEVLSAADNGSLAVLLAITSGISLAISRSAVFLVICLLLMLLVRMLCRRLVEQNLPPPSRKSRWRKLVSALLGALTGLVLVYTLSAALGMFLPYAPADSLVFPRSLMEQTDLCRYLNLLNPFHG